MKTRTEIKKINSVFKINYKNQILSLGSCFANHMAERMHNLKYQLLINPSGITFNPYSILTTIKRLIIPDTLPKPPVFYHQSLWADSELHSSFSHIDKKVFNENRLLMLAKSRKYLRNVDVVFLTIGTSYAYRDIKTGEIVNNCHKRSASEFEQVFIDFNETYDILTEIVKMIETYSQAEKVDFLLTLSPVRHIKNGVVADKKSKASALLAIHELVGHNSNCHYFPAYELMIDDLRDYRYYKADLIHPSEVAIDYIYKKLETSIFEESDNQLRSEIASVVNRQQHKLQFPESEASLLFTKQLNLDIEELIRKYPFLADRF